MPSKKTAFIVKPICYVISSHQSHQPHYANRRELVSVHAE